VLRWWNNVGVYAKYKLPIPRMKDSLQEESESTSERGNDGILARVGFPGDVLTSLRGNLRRGGLGRTREN